MTFPMTPRYVPRATGFPAETPQLELPLLSMVRPSASFENKRIALAFAHMVTSPAPASGPARQAVCRTGRYSLYDALSACCPSSVINQDPYVGKYGLRAIEFCKVVESDGFLKVRHQGLSDAGAEEVRYVYAGRRWRDPRDEEDMRALREAWEELAGSSTIFAGQCGAVAAASERDEEAGGGGEATAAGRGGELNVIAFVFINV
ncbi:hypothetical protein GUITHDRAFT_116839 [Guillardia theta CCMP2712]|uniref:Uncharacterized protein n=1 Tax=Guillardia theta (strain CCMP2712) TaxID=905079 RepID=L1IL40_GUITC|nr:hypothetical protein GUITHDRAFT_116839 [Guillardia theta CCMP2712]EKX36973.1 hypothetical protein GUITHDRAFT_116839 [Guillardia theta CCMP2712]|eukprot:XP_005823953.1 hypothetical protein GUITHDRAFT_116839 [Guillardia theta CCMP2712]